MDIKQYCQDVYNSTKMVTMLPKLDIFIGQYTERMNGQFLKNKDLYILYKEFCRLHSIEPVSNKALTQGMINMWSQQESTYTDSYGHTKLRYSKPVIRDRHLDERGWRHITISWYGKSVLQNMKPNN